MDQIKTISQQVTFFKKKKLEQNTTFTPSEKLTLHKSSLQTFKSIYILHSTQKSKSLKAYWLERK